MFSFLFYLVEFHDIDKKLRLDYNVNIGVPRFEVLMRVTFFGHSFLTKHKDIFDSVLETLLKNIPENEHVVFYCGGYGDFDDICLKACQEVRKMRGNCEIIFVTPYITEKYQEKMNGYIEGRIYDSIIYPPLENLPLRFAIVKRNEWMINESDLIITYINRSYGGASKAARYAKRRKKRSINLAQSPEFTE